MNRKLDAELAVKYHGWKWVNYHGNKDILIPPEESEMSYWTTMWDQDGIPHYLPEYSKEHLEGK